MTPADFRAWHEARGYTYDTGAAALEISRGTYADYLTGVSRTTGAPVKYKRMLKLAMHALAAGLDEWAVTNPAAQTGHPPQSHPPRKNR